MKKIFIFLILLYSFSFGEGCSSGSYIKWITMQSNYNSALCASLPSGVYGSTTKYKQLKGSILAPGSQYCYYNLLSYTCDTTPTTGEVPLFDVASLNQDCYTYADGSFVCYDVTNNGSYDRDGSLICDSGYYDDGAGSCVSAPSNSSGFDESGNLQCNTGYDVNSTNDGCDVSPSTNEDGTCKNGYYMALNIGSSSTCEPVQNTQNNDGTSTTIDENGSTLTFPDGTTSTTNPETGVITTTYPDGTVLTTYSDGTTTTSSSGGSTSASSVGGGTQNTNDENNFDSTTNDLPLNNIDENTSCNDTSLTLQEKMLCQINEGMKKQNSEDNQTNSLNNLLKDLRDNNLKDNTAINLNIKDIEALTTDIKSIQEKQLSAENTTALQSKATATNTANIFDKISQIYDGLFTSSETVVANPLSSVESDYDGFFSSWNDTYNTINTNLQTIETQYNSAKTTIENGFNLTLSNQNIVNCPVTYIMDLNSFGLGDKNITFDVCVYTSLARPVIYPIFYIMFSVIFAFILFRFIRGV